MKYELTSIAHALNSLDANRATTQAIIKALDPYFDDDGLHFAILCGYTPAAARKMIEEIKDGEA